MRACTVVLLPTLFANDVKIPDQFKVGAITWYVEMVPPGELDNDCGDMDRAMQRIRINRDMSTDMREATFLHELLHVLEVDMDHSHIETMSMLLHQVLKGMEV